MPDWKELPNKTLEPLEFLLQNIESMIDKGIPPIEDEDDWWGRKLNIYGFLDNLTADEINDILNILIKRFIVRNLKDSPYDKYNKDFVWYQDIYIMAIREYIKEGRVSPGDKYSCYTGAIEEDYFNRIKLQGFLERLWLKEVKQDANRNNKNTN